MKNFKKIKYSSLKPKQQESYNYQKISSVLAEYGFNTIKLSDDWEGADFIAQHINKKDFIKVQLKGRILVSKKYQNKGLWIALRTSNKVYFYPHDEFLEFVLLNSNIANTSSWKVKGEYHWPRTPQRFYKFLNEYLLE